MHPNVQSNTDKEDTSCNGQKYNGLLFKYFRILAERNLGQGKGHKVRRRDGSRKKKLSITLQIC